MDKEWAILEDIIALQGAYELAKKTGLTKRQLCEVGQPMRDKYGLDDLTILKLMRGEYSLKEIAYSIIPDCMNKT